MTDAERKILKAFVNMREEIAFKRLKDNTRYLEICAQQEKTETMVEELLHRFEKDERISIRQHYEGETAKQCFELEAAYLQGLRDSARFLAFLGIFDREVIL